MDTLIVNYAAREKRFAYLRNHRVEKIVFDRPEHRSLVGNIYYGTVTKVLPGMNAVFIDIGEDTQAYLHRDLLAAYVLSTDKGKLPITSLVHQGEKMLVQVNKDATGTKGPRLSGIIEIQGSSMIYMPQGRYVAVSKKIADETQKAALRRLGQRLKSEEEGIIFRTSSISFSEVEIREELTELRHKYEEMLQKAALTKKPQLIFQSDTFIEMILEMLDKMDNGEAIIDDLSLKKWLEQNHSNQNVKLTYYSGRENIFSVNRIEHELDKALKRIVWLENGAYLIFDETEALAVVDVNTGKFSGKSDYRETVLKTNQLAAREVVRQLRLRDIGGIVLIDFIDMKWEADRQSILKIIEEELIKDEKRIKLIGFTPLGILQLTRKKTKVTLSEALQVKCPVCDGTGRIFSAETIAFRLERELFEHRNSDFEAVLVETTEAVKALLAGAYQEVLEGTLQMKIYYSIQRGVSPYYLIKQFGTESEIAQKADEFY